MVISSHSIFCLPFTLIFFLIHYYYCYSSLLSWFWGFFSSCLELFHFQPFCVFWFSEFFSYTTYVWILFLFLNTLRKYFSFYLWVKSTYIYCNFFYIRNYFSHHILYFNLLHFLLAQKIILFLFKCSCLRPFLMFTYPITFLNLSMSVYPRK